MLILLRNLFFTSSIVLIGLNIMPLYGFAANASEINIDDSVSWTRGNNNEKYGLYSRTTSQMITPYIYDDYLSFADGIAAAVIDGKWGVIDTDGQTIIPFKYDYLLYFYYKNGKSRTLGRTKACLNGKWGYIDINEHQVIPLIYDKLWENDYADMWRYAIAQFNDKWGVIDRNGDILIPFEYDEIGFTKKDAQRITVWAKKAEKNGFIVVSPTGTLLYCRDAGTLYSDTVTWFRDFTSGKVGFVNADGSLLTAPLYDDASDFSDGMAMIWLDNKYGFVDIKGNLVIEPSYNVALEENGGAIQQMPLNYEPPPLPQGIEQSSIGPHAYLSMAIRHDWEEMYGENGNKALCVGDFACERALVQINGLFGYIDKNNRTVITPQYDGGTMFKELEQRQLFAEPKTIQAAAVKQADRWALIDVNGNLLTKFKYKYYEHALAAFE